VLALAIHHDYGIRTPTQRAVTARRVFGIAIARVGSRVPPSADFAEGILPLDSALPKIWPAIIAAQPEARKKTILERLRRRGVPNHLYNFKVGATFAQGPYAMLVREVAFHANTIGNHDYLRTPEIVEDICSGYEEHSGERILEETLKTFRPCIVKFEHPEDGREEQHHLNRYLSAKRSACFQRRIGT
jgi:hypothetical protein